MSNLHKFLDYIGIQTYVLRSTIKPDDKIVWLNKISVFRKTARINEALDLCNKLLVKNPNELTVLYHKLRLLKKLDMFKESNEICKKILKKYPSNVEIRNELTK